MTEYAQMRGITRTAVLKKITQGKLRTGESAEKIGNVYVITIPA